jgi:hypothetical protein
MKFKTQLLIAFILMLVCLLSGCSEEVFLNIGSSPSPSGGSCPLDTTCFDVSNVTTNPYEYDVSFSLDEPYRLVVSG